MQLSDLDFLLSPVGQRWLQTLSEAKLNDKNHLNWAMKLRDAVGSENVHALLETTLLRQKAASKFSRAESMYFDREGLEMSSAEIIASYRAQRYAQFSHVADLGCGIGGDALGLAQVAKVTAVDRQPLRLAMAQENLSAYGMESRFTGLEGDLVQLEPFSAEALFFDPARRTETGKRIFSLREYRPSITILERWRNSTRNWGVKISPGIDYAEIPAEAHVEFISVAGELREAILWFGDLRPSAERLATLLPSGAQLDSSADVDDRPISPPLAYLYEPDPAIIRAQLVRHLAHQLNAAQIDESIAYLTSHQVSKTALARCFELYDWFPFQLKRLRSYLREHKVGQVVIKKRGSPLEPDWLRQQLRLKGSEKRTLFLTQHREEPIVIVSSFLAL